MVSASRIRLAHINALCLIETDVAPRIRQYFVSAKLHLHTEGPIFSLLTHETMIHMCKCTVPPQMYYPPGDSKEQVYEMVATAAAIKRTKHRFSNIKEDE